jgi:hypothetical protein
MFDPRVGNEQVEQPFAFELDSLRAARTWVVETLTAWDLDVLSGPATLVVNEFVTHALVSGGPPLAVRMAQHGRSVHLEVADGKRHAPFGASPRSVESQLARRIVDSVASAWGEDQTTAGTVVWASLTVPARADGDGRPRASRLDGERVAGRGARPHRPLRSDG